MKEYQHESEQRSPHQMNTDKNHVHLSNVNSAVSKMLKEHHHEYEQRSSHQLEHRQKYVHMSNANSAVKRITKLRSHSSSNEVSIKNIVKDTYPR